MPIVIDLSPAALTAQAAATVGQRAGVMEDRRHDLLLGEQDYRNRSLLEDSRQFGLRHGLDEREHGRRLQEETQRQAENRANVSLQRLLFGVDLSPQSPPGGVQGPPVEAPMSPAPPQFPGVDMQNVTPQGFASAVLGADRMQDNMRMMSRDEDASARGWAGIDLRAEAAAARRPAADYRSPANIIVKSEFDSALKRLSDLRTRFSDAVSKGEDQESIQRIVAAIAEAQQVYSAAKSRYESSTPTDMDPDAWMDANPQGASESDEDYEARYLRATGG